MQLSDARKAYYDNSATLSELTRKLGFAGIALIWLFKQQNGSRLFIPSDLHIATVLVVVSLGMDLLQYVWSTAVWGGFARVREKQRLQKRKIGVEVKDDEDVQAPDWINRPTIFLFWTKTSSMLTAYIWILRFLFKAVW